MERHGAAVIEAPPGAGKTTRVPLALLPLIEGRILMLEPRRIAARAAAERMAATLGEAVGETVGYRIRGEAKVGRASRIEVMTEGILTRMLQDAPDLPGVGCLIFDEFHERSLHADLGLALALEVREVLRPDLVLIAMSATLDAAPVARLMGDAPVVRSTGRSFPVETDWRDPGLADSRARRASLPARVAEAVRELADGSAGAVLAFLPGVGEIARTREALAGRGDVAVLHGSLPFREQAKVLATPARPGRIVLATSIAETSLTIPDVRAVVDAGLARRQRADAATGISGLVTERVSRAEADQRRGRAGRVGPGHCLRLWPAREEGSLAPFAPAEIETADLTALALELAAWGVRDVAALALLTPPPKRALAEARELLARLGALDPAGGLTPLGRTLSRVPTHPRLARMIAAAKGKREAQAAVELAALLEARDVLRGEGGPPPADLALRRAVLKGDRQDRPHDPAAVASVRAEARRLTPKSTGEGGRSPGALLSLAYPDRIAMVREGAPGRYKLANGTGAELPPGDALTGTPFLIAADVDAGAGREARIRRALAVTEEEVRTLHQAAIATAEICRWSRRHRRVETLRETRLGALTLASETWPDPSAEALAAAQAEGIRDLGLGCLTWSPAAERFLARLRWARQAGADLPDFGEEALLATLEDWLCPHLGRARSAADFAAADLLPALEARLDWPARQRLDAAAPASWSRPGGRTVPIHYGEAGPEIRVRLQALFGLTHHPTIGRDRIPLRITLLSPADRPVQTTADLPGFWASSYADVRRDMRGRYPKHPWPEDPATAEPPAPRGRDIKG